MSAVQPLGTLAPLADYVFVSGDAKARADALLSRVRRIAVALSHATTAPMINRVCADLDAAEADLLALGTLLPEVAPPADDEVAS